MLRRSTIGGAVLAAVIVATWFSLSDASTPGRARAVRAARAAPPMPLAHRSSSPGLSLSELAGQRIVYAYSGLEPPPSLLAAIHAGQAAGVILFAPNIASSGQIRTVTAEFQRAALASPLHAPLLMLTDQEGGQVRRLPGAPVASEKQIGQEAGAPSAAARAGSGAGRNLASAGINVNLAPVLDVYRQAGNFIDEFQRSYSTDPRKVATLGAAFITSQQRYDVAATAKHFPGLGAATRAENSDLEPVRLDLSLATLRSVDEAPYRAAIASGVRLVMTSWATYPALDPNRPAGLSPLVIQHELRGRLRFRGVTITDGIDAGAVTPFGGLGRRSVLAAAAGSDLILCASTNPNDNSPRIGLTVLRALTAALREGQLARAPAQRAAARVIALRRLEIAAG